MNEALELPRIDRTYLVSKLLESLDEEQDLAPEWKEEIAKRVARRASGETKQISREELHQDIETILA